MQNMFASRYQVLSVATRVESAINHSTKPDMSRTFLALISVLFSGNITDGLIHLEEIFTYTKYSIISTIFHNHLLLIQYL